MNAARIITSLIQVPLLLGTAHAWELEPCLQDVGSFLRVKATSNGVIATTNHNTYYTSADGITWHPAAASCENQNGFSITSVTQYGEQLAAVGSGIAVVDNKSAYIGAIYTGATSLTCTGHHSQAVHSLPLTDIVAVPAATPHFLMVGEKGTVLSCVDPWATLTCTTDVTSDFYSVAATDKEAVAVGFNGAVAYAKSPFTRWKSLAVDASISFFGVKYIDNCFMAVGTKGTILRITTDSTWTLSSLGTDRWLADIAKGDIGYVAVSYGGLSQSSSFVFHSTNATTWDILDTVPSKLRSIDFIDNGKTLIAGGDGLHGQEGGIVYRLSTSTALQHPLSAVPTTHQSGSYTKQQYSLTGRKLLSYQAAQGTQVVIENTPSGASLRVHSFVRSENAKKK